MKLASIVPMKSVAKTFEGSYAMVLAHLKDYYPQRSNRSKNCYVIMDNSLIELGGAVTLDMLLEAAERIQPDEIILPDVFCKGFENYQSIRNSIIALKYYGLLGKYKIMAVCQGETASEFSFYFKLLTRFDEIDCIGIPKVATTLFGERWKAEHLWQHGCNKEIHLLGCWSSLDEIRHYKNPTLIRSIDTCIPALLSTLPTCKSIWAKRPLYKTIDLINDELGPKYDDFIRTLEGEKWI